jgi:dipeptidyl aminopeptidase/acylaminoacyl peptidase
VALVERKPAEFFALPAKPDGAQWANPPRIVRDYPYRADGEGWLVPGELQLFVLEVASGRQRQLTSGPGDWGGRDEAPAWFPDSQSIVVSADTDPAARRRANQGDLWRVPLQEGGAAQRLTEDDGFETSPAVSPDGRSLAYVGWRKRANSFQRTDIFLLPLEGKQPGRNLTAALDRNAASPRWRDDGTGIHFLYQDEGVNRVGVATLTGETRVLVPQVGNTRLLLPSSSGGTYSAAAERFAYPSVEADRPATLALWSDGRQRVLWDMNAEWRAGKLIGRLEEIRIASKADRRSVHGWILYPPNFDPTRRYPLALDIHGGPHLDYGPMFSITHHLYAAAGYVVLFVNPRGSIGYGEEFASLIHLAYPGRDHDDLMSAVDSVVARGFIDPRRLYIGGGSGGGVLSSWAIGKTDRFAAASVKRPVINWASTTLTTDIGAVMGQYWFERMPWEQPEKYWARSPLSLVGKVTTPTLIITGEEDWRTPMSDSEQYFQALQLRGVESALMRLPEASHGFGRPSQWLAAILGTIGWYDQHTR